MPDSDSKHLFCKYCLEGLQNEFEKFHEAHSSCSKEFEKFNARYEPFVSQIQELFPDHEIKLFLEPKINLRTLRMFSHSQLLHIQDKLSKLSAESSPHDKFIIILFHRSELAYIILNQIDYIPDFLLTIESLLYLSITLSPACPFIDQILLKNLPNLLCLEIILTAEYSFPKIISTFNKNQIKYLKLRQSSSNPNNFVPDGIESCRDLEILILDIPLDEFPTSLCYLSKLRSLHISGSKINWKLIVPNTMVNLSKLEDLRIFSHTKPVHKTDNESKMQITNINSIELTNITVEQKSLNLQKLHIEGFALGYDEIFPILNAKRMNELSIIHCDVDEISEEFIIFEGLKKLDFSHNRIAQIPDFIRLLGSIEYINISYNKLVDFTNLCHINRINEIDVSYNLVESFPSKLITKKKLQINFVGNNLLRNSSDSNDKD